jgi:hypothetical protein
MDGSSCVFDRVRSRPANFIKGTKRAAYCPKARNSPQSLARRPASHFFLPATSPYHEVLTVSQLGNSDAACSGADAARPAEGFCHAAPRLSLLCLLPPPRSSIFFREGTAPKPFGGAAGRTRCQQRTRFQKGGRREHGQSDARGHRACMRIRPGRRLERKLRWKAPKSGRRRRQGWVLNDPRFFFINRAERKKTKLVGAVGRALSLLLTPRAQAAAKSLGGA